MLKREKELMLFGLKPDQHSFEGLGLFLFIYIGASLFASVLTAPTYWLIEWWNEIAPCETSKWLVGKPIDVFYDRLRWAPILLGLPWMMKRCKLFSIKNLGIPISLKSVAVYLKYFAFGLILAVSIYFCQWIFGTVKVDSEFSTDILGKILFDAILGAVIVSFLEELVFRCLILRSVYTAFDTISAIILTSLFFAYKHFKVPNSIWDSLPGGIHSSTWDIGFFVCWYDTIGIASQFNLMVFTSLAMFGAVLAAAYIRKKILWAPAGMHAGVVFAMLTYRNCFDVVDSPATEYVGSTAMTNGYLALVVLTILFFVFLFGGRKTA